MSYVDAFLDRKTDKVRVVERDKAGNRAFKDFPAPYVFYHENKTGTHRSIFGHTAKRFSTSSSQKFRAAISSHLENGTRIFESDINPTFRCLAENYVGQDEPQLNIGFFDIETDFNDHDGKYNSGYAPPTDPHNAITAISIYSSKTKGILSFVLKPPTLTYSEASAIVEEIEDTYLFDNEKELLDEFLKSIEDIDVLTGWNSSAYDITYLVNRIERIIGKESTKLLCLWDQFPSPREYKNKFGKMVQTYDLVGRVHLDYLELYAKHNPKQRLSYALNAIGLLEVKESKVAYEGNLDDLFKKEFKKFIIYNRQDVFLMVKIDAKLRYIGLHNQVAHSNFVVLKTTMGSVSLIEQSIINEMHEGGLVVPNRKAKIDVEEFVAEDDDDDDEIEDGDEHWKKIDDKAPVVGAYVAHPKKGLHRQIGCIDLKSLYPSVIRALNMSPETLVGQVRLTETMTLVSDRASKLPKVKRAEAWDGLFSTIEFSHMLEKSENIVTVDMFDFEYETTNSMDMTGKQLYDFNKANHYCITANGTIFRTDVEGIIPRLLARWYKERTEMQAKEKEFAELASGIEIDDELSTLLDNLEVIKSKLNIDVSLRELIKKRDVQAIKLYCEENELCIKNGKIVPNNDEAKKKILFKVGFWNQRQQARKILLNSLYGALLNVSLRFYDERLGQSVTLTGRSVVRHMNATINQLITGKYDYRGDAIIYSDTDSGYFSAYQILKDDPDYAGFEWSRENIIILYDHIAEQTNETFAKFMSETFNTSLEKGGIIQASRELIASTGLFIKKKKYAVLMYDKEGERLDKDGPGSLKIMGLDIKRADTPKYMQEFLENMLMDILIDKEKETIYENIKEFRKMFKTRPGWEKGSPKKVAELSKYDLLLRQNNDDDQSMAGRKKASNKKKVAIPGHVRASMNWNKLREVNHDKYVLDISDSSRIIVCKLAPNTMNMTSVAYPIDETHLPEWFKVLPFDHTEMETTIIDKKILNIVGVLEWNLTDTVEKAADDVFSWN